MEIDSVTRGSEVNSIRITIILLSGVLLLMYQILRISFEHDEITLDVFQYIHSLADSLYSNAKTYVNEISDNVSQRSRLFDIM